MPAFSIDTDARRAADFAACRTLLRGGSRSFFAASLLLPRRVREPASALYAFCRLADDAVDLGSDRERALDALRQRLDAAYAGRPAPEPTERAFADVIERFDIPRALPEALLEGFAWDASGHRYEDIDALNAYGARVAGTVGAMMALVMGTREPDAIARASDLGGAMQLTNIARDVGEDARAGRLYLPLAWLREAGIDPDAWMARPVFNPAIAGVLQRLLRAADALYTRGESGISLLPADCRPAILAARHLYAGIGHELERRGYDSVSQRTVVPSSTKARLVARAITGSMAKRPAVASPALVQARFLVDAVTSAPARNPRLGQRAPRWWNLRARYVGVIDLFERLERRERLARS